MSGDRRSRRAIRVRGVVQGVGFRPAVYRIAHAAGLAGFVRNDAEGVWIEIEGEHATVAAFAEALRREAPPLASIDAIEISVVPTLGEREFRVDATPSVLASAPKSAVIPADAATCDACLRELFDPSDRRHRYPFINCTDCGPRFTIIRDVPYDRAKTTMDSFAMCEGCKAEYADPANRRFHAEPNACPECGPQVALVVAGRRVASGEAALAHGVALLASSGILAVKGLGGYQLAVRADAEDAVRRLRARKRRPDKPFALMARDLAVCDRIASVPREARVALASPARPIVLLAAKTGSSVAASVSPRMSEVGVMLPSTPLHHLLLAKSDLLVMTSGNLSEEPIAKDDDDAVASLDGIADAFLVHDRPIHTRADDSVVRVNRGVVVPLRRARGYVPSAVSLAFDAPPVLGVGAAQKSTICLVRGHNAYVSQHIGDLESPLARAFFEEVIEKLERLLGIAPELVAHDLHPDYASTRWALARGLPCVGVQHHHAHVASCLAEHGRSGPAIGVAFDGTGCGPAGELWGGEFLLCDLMSFTRVGHLRAIALPGAEVAIRAPWRLALAALLDAGEPLDLLARIPHQEQRFLGRMIERKILSPKATGAGRWFDAVAALLGVRDAISYEAQAAIELEALARRGHDDTPYAFEIEAKQPFEVDLRPTIRAIATDLRNKVYGARIAARFYATLAETIANACAMLRRVHGLETVALSGGCFQSELLTERARCRLERDGFEVLTHRLVPPNDGGIALGQAAVAAYRARSATHGGGGDVSRHTG